MYKIIGGDGHQYGPVDADQIRRWIAEGRLNGLSQLQFEGTGDWKSLTAFPEFAEALAARTGEPQPPRPFALPPNPPAPAVLKTAGPGDFQIHDYSLDIGGCIRGGWNLFKDNLGLLLCGTLIYLAIESAIAGLGAIPLIGPVFSILNLLIAGPLMAGLLYLFLRTIRRERADVADVFAGFRQQFGHLLLGQLVSALLGFLCFIPALIVTALVLLPAIIHRQPPTFAAILIVVVVTLLCFIPFIYLQVNWIFTLPLIIDKRLEFWPAMQLSWKGVNKHWLHIFALLILIGLINAVGFLVCCAGMLFTMPIGFGALMFAYETIYRPSIAPTA